MDYETENGRYGGKPMAVMYASGARSRTNPGI